MGMPFCFPRHRPDDWSIEDLPDRASDTEFPVLGARYGAWKLRAGDGNWSAPGLDDSAWMEAKGGEDWRGYGPQWQAANLTAWYRQHLSASAELANSSETVTLSLGVISGTDITCNPLLPPAHPPSAPIPTASDTEVRVPSPLQTRTRARGWRACVRQTSMGCKLVRRGGFIARWRPTT